MKLYAALEFHYQVLLIILDQLIKEQFSLCHNKKVHYESCQDVKEYNLCFHCEKDFYYKEAILCLSK